MATKNKSTQQKLPLSIRLIAPFYVIQAAVMLSILISTRQNISLTPITDDAVTVLLLFIPLLALRSIYHPQADLRWFPLYSIPFMWVIAVGFGYFGHPWLMGSVGDEATPEIAFMMVTVPLTALTIWMLIAAALLYFIPSARHHIFRRKS